MYKSFVLLHMKKYISARQTSSYASTSNLVID